MPTYYHASPFVFDEPNYTKLSKIADSKAYGNRHLGLFAQTDVVGQDVYGQHFYNFQLAPLTTVLEVSESSIRRSRNKDYYEGMRRAYLAVGVDVLKTNLDEDEHMIIVLNFDKIQYWERAHWKHAFYRSMPKAVRLDKVKKGLKGDLFALAEAFCCNRAPMGGGFWLDQYQRLEDGKKLTNVAIDNLKDALDWLEHGT